jgi:hypothetical protein
MQKMLAGPLVVEAGHLVREERADEYAYLIADWVADGYRAAAARGPTAALMSPATDGGNDEVEQ